MKTFLKGKVPPHPYHKEVLPKDIRNIFVSYLLHLKRGIWIVIKASCQSSTPKNYVPAILGAHSRSSYIDTIDSPYENELSLDSIETAVDSWRSDQDGREIICQVFPVSVDELFSLLFTNSKFYHEFHSSRKTFGKIV